MFSDELNGCTSSPCINGVYVNGDSSYTCICDQGFSGVNCDGIVNLFILVKEGCKWKYYIYCMLLLVVL